MEKLISQQLLTKLKKTAPELPIEEFKKIERASIEQLLRLAPECPYRVVNGIKLLERLEIPLNPIKQ